MTAVVRGDALHIPLRDESVDLIVTSPPYFALRSYRDGCPDCKGEGKAPRPDSHGIKVCPQCGYEANRKRCNRCDAPMRWPKRDEQQFETCQTCNGSGSFHYDGQIGSEPTPQAFLEALWAVTAELWRVLKPSGSLFVNLGDKRVNPPGQGNPGTGRGAKMASSYVRPPRLPAFGRPKSKMLLPHRYAIGCEDGHADPDGIGWIVRSDIVWSKPNGLPESVRDRVRDSHEYWFHLTKQGDYYSAVDEIREAQTSQVQVTKAGESMRRSIGRVGVGGDATRPTMAVMDAPNPLGKLPGSVWSIPSEPLTIPDWVGVGHFAAFPQEWPRRLILGWSPSGICVECGEGRRPVVAKDASGASRTDQWGGNSGILGAPNPSPRAEWATGVSTTITGYACACTPYTDHAGSGGDNGHGKGWSSTGNHQNNPGGGLANNSRVGPTREYHLTGWRPPPTRPAVVLDPFGGTGTVAMVARTLGRTGISLDLSADYCRLAKWRIFDSGHASKTRERTNRAAQGALL